MCKSFVLIVTRLPAWVRKCKMLNLTWRHWIGDMISASPPQHSSHRHTHGFSNQCGWPDFSHQSPRRREIEKPHLYYISLLWQMANGGFFSVLQQLGTPIFTSSLLVTPTTLQPALGVNNFAYEVVEMIIVKWMWFVTGQIPGQQRLMDETQGQICNRK